MAGRRRDSVVRVHSGAGVMIERLDPAAASDDDLACVHAVQVACREPGNADLLRTQAEYAAWIRYPMVARWRDYRIARDPSGTVIGFAAVTLATGATTAIMHDLLVVPERRHHGVGRALLDTVAAACTARGAAVLHGVVTEPAGQRFADAAGARPGNRMRLSALRMPAGLPAPRPTPGYRVRSWTASAPPELLPSYAQARNAINDAPHDADAAPDTWDAVRVRDLEATIAHRGQQSRVTVAVDATGRVVGFTELHVGPEHGTVAHTEDTAVVAAHRGRGLARRVKVESLRLLTADRPDVRAVTTANDITNAPMLAVNTALGFTETAVQTDAFLPLASK